MQVDLDQEQRRAERLADLSRSAFMIALAALAAVAVLTFVYVMPEIFYHG